MRIGVKHAIDEDHLAVRAKNSLGERWSIDPARVEREEVGDFDPVDELRRQHALRRQLRHDDGEMHLAASGEVVANERDVSCFLREVELFANELTDVRVIGLEPADPDEELNEREHPTENAKVELRDLLDVGVLHFDGDFAAVMCDGRVHLRQRGARDGHRVELGEELLGRSTELFANAGANLVERPRWNAVLKLLELCAEFGGEKVGENTDELPDFDEQPAQLEDGADETFRACAMTVDESRVVEAGSENWTPQPQPEVSGENADGEPVGSCRTEASRA